MAKNFQIIDRINDVPTITSRIGTFLGGGGAPAGGGQQGGSVVQYTPKDVADKAGQYGVQAANEASTLATKSYHDAINQINTQYMGARSSVQPYATEGVQALNKLNSYLQLDPYNPGIAPTKPDINDFVTNYITDHSEVGRYASGLRNEGLYQYSGPGAFDNAKTIAEFQPGTDPKNPTEDLTKQSGWFGNMQSIKTDGTLRDSVQKYLLDNNMVPDINNYNQELFNYNQNMDMYNKYKAAGPLTAGQISDNISNLPGYQAQLTQGIDAISKDASAKGYLGSGRQLKELNTFGQGTLSQFYGNELSRLAGLAGIGQQAATQQSNSYQNQGNALAGLYTQLGDTQANAALSRGNSLAQAAITGGQQFKVVGGSDGGGGGGGLGGIGSLLSGGASLLGALKVF